MRIVIVGCGRTGSRLARLLDEGNHDVTVIDWNEQAFQRLPDDFRGQMITGNGIDQDDLARAGLAQCDVFVAATSGDNRNIMASQVAQNVFSVRRVITRIKDPIRAQLYEGLGLTVDCRTIEGSRIILEQIDMLAQEPSHPPL